MKSEHDDLIMYGEIIDFRQKLNVYNYVIIEFSIISEREREHIKAL